MKQFFGVMGLILVSMSFCCTPKVKTPAEARKELVDRLERETIALVSIDEEENLHTYCSGVWVSETRMLTARHCVDDMPVVLFTGLGDSMPHLARVVDVEENDDLALLETLTNDVPGHPFAPVASDVWDGDRKSTRLNSSHVSESRMPSSA